MVHELKTVPIHLWKFTLQVPKTLLFCIFPIFFATSLANFHPPTREGEVEPMLPPRHMKPALRTAANTTSHCSVTQLEESIICPFLYS